MKHAIFSLLTLTIVLFSACNKSNDDNGTAITTGNVNSTVAAGSWRITYYWDTDHDETSNYSGYSFVFGSGNVLTATKSGLINTGTWTSGTDDSQVKLILDFSTAANFVEISDDWHVIEITGSKIRLEDVSGGGSGTDFLTFEKN